MTNDSIVQDRLNTLNRDIDILFVNCPHYNVQFPNSGIAYLCEAVKSAGLVPAVLDINILLLQKYKPTGLTEYWEESKSAYLWNRPQGFEEMRYIFAEDLRQFAEFIAASPAPVIGFSVNMMNERCSDDIAQRVRRLAPEKKILFGGYSYYHESIAPEVSEVPDAVAIGDAEESLVSYLEALRSRSDPGNIPGLISRTNGGWGSFRQALPTTPVDSIRWPQWEEFVLPDYTFLYPAVHLPVHSSRGCFWGRCTFCSAAPTNPGYRHRSAESIFAEFKHNYDCYGVTDIFLTTLQVNGDFQQLDRLCDLIIESGIDFTPYGQFTIHKRMTYDFCRKLRRAGFRFIDFGLESGSDEVLRRMRKGFNVKVAKRVLKDCHEAGIITSVNVIVGHPAETEERFQETLDFLERNRGSIDQLEIVPTLNLQYGSEMWDAPEQYGIRFERGRNQWIVNDWVSLDGANTFDLRLARQARLLSRAEELGISRGYAAQKLNFREDQGPESSASLFRVMLRSRIDTLLPAPVRRVLLLRSSPHEQVLAFIEEVRRARPSLELHLLAQPGCAERYRRLPGVDRVVSYGSQGFFNVRHMAPELLQSLAASGYDTVFFLYGPLGRHSYVEVKNLALSICGTRSVGVDMSGDFDTFAAPAPSGTPPVIDPRAGEALQVHGGTNGSSHDAAPGLATLGPGITELPGDRPDRPFAVLFPPGVDMLLVNAPHFNVVYPPSGIAYVCEAVKAEGFSVGVFDLNAALINRYRDCEIERFWHAERAIECWIGSGYAEVEARFGKDFDEAANAIAATRSPVVGFSVNMMNLRTADRIAARVRELSPAKIIVYGGYSCYHEEICRRLSPQPDYICVGEAEATSAELMRALMGGGDPGAVPGVMEARRGRGRFEPRPREEQLDRLLWPRWNEFDLSGYHILTPFHTVSVNASRGCAWARCHFCSDSKTTPGFRRRSAESMLEEIAACSKQHGTRNFHLSDLIVNGDHAELERFCDLVTASGLSMCFSGQFHIDRRLTPALLAKLKTAGMPIINFGLETGSERMMRLMRKGYNMRVAEECMRNCKAAGLVTDINLLVGYPGETIEDVEETARFLERNRDFIDIVEVVNICSIHYGSDLWVESSRFGVRLQPEPGAREDRLWVSADGSNTFAERLRRAAMLKKKIEELGLGKGYHSQEFKFLLSGARQFRPASYLAMLRLSSRDVAIPESGRTLVLRSCDVDRAVPMLQGLRDLMPGVCLDLLLQESVRERLAPYVNGEILAYPGGPLSVEHVPPPMIEALSRRNYDAVIVPYGCMPESSYAHVRALTRAIGAEPVLTISASGKLCRSEVANHAAARPA